jgi:hypothetical protein
LLTQFYIEHTFESTGRAGRPPPRKDGSVAAKIRSALSRARLEWLAVVAFVVAATVASLYANGHDVRRFLSTNDFPAFYCAGQVARTGADPYQRWPLETCERSAAWLPAGYDPPLATLEPAPLPGYLVAFFAIVSLVPYLTASVLWVGLTVVATLAAIWALRELTGLPRLAIAAALFATDIVDCIAWGQLAPVAMLGIALCGLFLRRGQPRAAAFAALLTLIQPQLGLPVMLALFVWVPRARLVLVLAAVVFAGLSLLWLGPAANLEYVRQVLPGQAASEAPFRIQYSFTWLLYFFGASEAMALKFSGYEYALAALAGVLLAPRVAKALDAPEALVAFPAACALLGGTYLHLFQMCAAVPFGLILVARAPRLRPVAWAGLALLALPWNALGARAWYLGGAVALLILLLAAGEALPRPRRAALTIAALALYLLFPRVLATVPNALRPPAPIATFQALGFDRSVAAVQHGYNLRLDPELTATSWRQFVEKVPDWAGLLLLFGAGLAASGQTAVATSLGRSRS